MTPASSICYMLTSRWRRRGAKSEPHYPGAEPGGGGGSRRSGPPSPFGVPPDLLDREKTPRAYVQIHRILVVNRYPDPPPPPFLKSCIRPCSRIFASRWRRRGAKSKPACCPALNDPVTNGLFLTHTESGPS